MNTNEYLPERVATLIDDIQQFADPYTPVRHLKLGSHQYEAKWQYHGQERKAIIVEQNGDEIRIEYNGLSYTHAGFLAHDDLANLSFLARSTIAQLRHHGLHSGGKVETHARINSIYSSPVREGVAHQLIDEAVRERYAGQMDSDNTRVVFLAAQAGAGKTKVLERLGLLGAELFLRGESSYLYLYVNAQGKALARVDEAFAVELDRLGSNLRYSAIAALTRVGALIPVIDGFDELIGAVTYDEAFQSLGRFMEELKERGQIVAAARSTYYEREFQGRVRKRSHNIGWELITVQLLPWEGPQRQCAVEEQAQILIDEKLLPGISAEHVEFAKRRLEEIAHAYPGFISRPFFAVQAARALLRGEHLDHQDEDLLRQLTSALVHREVSQKFLDKNQMPMTTFDALWTFFCEVAAEMWFQQTRALDSASLDVVLSVSTENWQPVAIDRLKERKRDMPVFASVSGSSDSSPVGFAHDYFFSIFLADSFIRTIFSQKGFSIHNALSRGILPEELPTALIAVANRQLRDNFLDILNGACRVDSLRSSIVKENAGTLAAALLYAECKTEYLKPVLLQGMIFGNVSISGNISKLDCSNCLFRRTDLRSLRVKTGKWSNCQLELVEVSNQTKLQVEELRLGVDVRGLRVYGNNDWEDVWEPGKIRERFVSMGVKVPQTLHKRNVSTGIIKIVDKIARIYYTRVKFADRDDLGVNFIGSPDWPKVLRALLDKGIVAREVSGASGLPKSFYRCLVDPAELMAGLDPQAKVRQGIMEFWDELEN